MPTGLFANYKMTLVFAAIVLAIAVLVSFTVSGVLPDQETREEPESAAAVEKPTEQLPTWSQSDADGWGASAISAAQSGDGFGASSSSSRLNPFGNYTPDPDQERGSRPGPSPYAGRRIISGREAAEMLEPRGDGMAAIPLRVTRAR